MLRSHNWQVGAGVDCPCTLAKRRVVEGCRAHRGQTLVQIYVVKWGSEVRVNQVTLGPCGPNSN
jgi:hypothetical protein